VTLVLLVLAAIWAAVLIPPAIRARAEGRPGDSITNFRRQQAVLRRTGPRVGRATGPDHWYRQHAPHSAPLAPVHGPVRSRTATVNGHRGATVTPLRPSPSAAASAARSRTLRRRRDVLTALVVAVLATLVLGLLPPFRVLWMAHVVADILLVAYVALLVHQRNVSAERDMKVRFLPRTAAFEPALVRNEPALLRRSAN
jgi:hypothetical protein